MGELMVDGLMKFPSVLNLDTVRAVCVWLSLKKVVIEWKKRENNGG